MKAPEEHRIWWKHGVIYHIYPRSFQDSNGDGIGDIRGIIRRIGYLKELGIDGIWISPMYQSPMVDFGYDVSDYRSIDPVFGTMEEFTELLKVAHESGIRVILDVVLNHTSDRHPWFIASSSSVTNPKRKWYIWKEGIAGSPPNNWKSAAGGSAWTFDEKTKQFYLHSFFREQPDLNWRNDEVQEAVFEEMKFWLDLGVDGFRLDVINLVVKDKKFRNNPAFLGIHAFQKHVYTRNRKRSITLVTRIRQLLDRYDSRVSIGEIYAPPPGDPRNAARYQAKGHNGLHLTFDFSLIFTRWNAHAYFRCIRNWYECIPAGGWPCHVQSNHDLLRNIDRLPWRTYREQKAKVAATLLLTLKGTPFIYYGEEIGMHNARIPRSRIQDPLGKRYWPLFAGRDQARTPMQWTGDPGGGFTEGEPWLPLSKDTASRNVRRQEGASKDVQPAGTQLRSGGLFNPPEPGRVQLFSEDEDRGFRGHDLQGYGITYVDDFTGQSRNCRIRNRRIRICRHRDRFPNVRRRSGNGTGVLCPIQGRGWPTIRRSWLFSGESHRSASG